MKNSFPTKLTRSRPNFADSSAQTSDGLDPFSLRQLELDRPGRHRSAKSIDRTRPRILSKHKGSWSSQMQVKNTPFRIFNQKGRPIVSQHGEIVVFIVQIRRPSKRVEGRFSVVDTFLSSLAAQTYSAPVPHTSDHLQSAGFLILVRSRRHLVQPLHDNRLLWVRCQPRTQKLLHLNLFCMLNHHYFRRFTCFPDSAIKDRKVNELCAILKVSLTNGQLIVWMYEMYVLKERFLDLKVNTHASAVTHFLNISMLKKHASQWWESHL